MDPRRALDEGAVDVVLEALTADAWLALDEDEREGVELDAEFEGARIFGIRFHASRSASREGAVLLREHLLDARTARRDSILVQVGFPIAPERVAMVDTVNVATEDDVSGARLGRFLTLILVGLMLLGGSAVATDTLAGEKERGTLITLLTSAATRTEIVTGKLLAIMAVAFGIALVQILNLWIFLGLGLLDPAAGFAAHMTPGLAAGLMVLYLPVVALAGGILMFTSAYAQTYKEAQLYMTPVLIGMAIPTLAPLLSIAARNLGNGTSNGTLRSWRSSPATGPVPGRACGVLRMVSRWGGRLLMSGGR